jgi:hypothetical protein
MYLANGRFRTIADNAGFRPGTVCPLLIQSVHRGRTKVFGRPHNLNLFIDGAVDHYERVALFAYFAT